MDRIIRNIGIVLIFIALLILFINFILNKNSNTMLGISALLIVAGLLSYIFLQKYYN